MKQIINIKIVRDLTEKEEEYYKNLSPNERKQEIKEQKQAIYELFKVENLKPNDIRTKIDYHNNIKD